MRQRVSPHSIWSSIVGFRRLASVLALAAAWVSIARPQGIPMPPSERMNERVDPSLVRQVEQATNTVNRNPKDVTALVTRGALCLNIANQSRYGFFWIYKASKDLEAALRLDPNNFYVRHNYAQAAFQVGDMGSDQPNMRLAVTQFTKAIQLNPKSARSYMGRGFAYQMLNQNASMRADYDMALRLDPALRGDLVKESEAIANKRAQLAGVPAMLDRMARYYVESGAHTQNQCMQYKGYWTNGECRISMAFDPR